LDVAAPSIAITGVTVANVCCHLFRTVLSFAKCTRSITAALWITPDALEVHVATKKPLCVVVDCPIHGQVVHTLYKEEKGK